MCADEVIRSDFNILSSGKIKQTPNVIAIATRADVVIDASEKKISRIHTQCHTPHSSR